MKPILVAYVNIGLKSSLKAKEHCDAFRKDLLAQIPDSANLTVLVIPIKEGSNRIEYLNPTTIVSESFKSIFNNVEKGMTEMEKTMDKTFEEMGKSMDKFSERMEKAFDAFKKG